MASVQFVGLDVHKDTLDATVMLEGTGLRLRRGATPTLPRSCKNSSGVFNSGDRSLRHTKRAAWFSAPADAEGDGGGVPGDRSWKMPRFTSDRIKTDRRDARAIAKLLNSGEVTPINVPTPRMRPRGISFGRREDLRAGCVRATEVDEIPFALRVSLSEGSYWAMRFARWLSELQFPHPLLKETFDGYRLKVGELKDQMRLLDERVVAIAEQKQYAQRVGRLRCFRGIDHLIALALVVEVGDFRRFPTAASFMAYLGLVPREMSSGGSRRQGGITKSGNGHLRKLLIEASWHSRSKPSVSKRLRERRQGQAAELIAYADRAMNRLHQKYIKIVVRGKTKQTAVTAAARELAGFAWGMMVGKID